MNLLAFDTCFGACSAAVAIGGSGAQAVFHRCEAMETGHAERLVPMIGELMAEAGIAFGSLGRIAVTVGPGTFTGTRTGIAAARALALSIGCPAAGLSSLEVLAAGAECPGRIAAVVDARRGEVYLQLFDRPGGSVLCEPRIVAVPDAARVAAEGGFALAGNGARAVQKAARDLALEVEVAGVDLLPRARDMIALVARAPASDAALRPLYLRAPDAKPQPDQGLRRAGT